MAEKVVVVEIPSSQRRPIIQILPREKPVVQIVGAQKRAIVEVVRAGPAGDPSVLIDDASTSADATWSSYKIATEIGSVSSDVDAVAADVANLLHNDLTL